MAQEVKLIDREENYTNPFTLESQLKQVEWHGVFITSVANKIVDAIARYNALWLLKCYDLIFFFFTAKTETWGEKGKHSIIPADIWKKFMKSIDKINELHWMHITNLISVHAH